MKNVESPAASPCAPCTTETSLASPASCPLNACAGVVKRGAYAILAAATAKALDVMAAVGMFGGHLQRGEKSLPDRASCVSHTHVSRLLALKRLGRAEAVTLFQRRALFPPSATSIWTAARFVLHVVRLRHAMRAALRETWRMGSDDFARMDDEYYANGCHGESMADFFVRAAIPVLPIRPIAPTRSNTGYFGPCCTRQQVQPTWVESVACLCI